MLRFTKKMPLFFLLMLLVSLSAPAFAGKLGKISGYKFNDLNGNGIDDNEPRLQGFTITVTSLSSDFEEETLTDEDGRFVFKDLARGKYQVCETAPEATPAWEHTTPECVVVNLKGKVPHAKVKFGNRQPEVGPLGQIVGLKFNDVDGDGIKGETEVGLAGWTINIEGITDPTFTASTTTGEGGFYSFTNLPLGSYKVCEVEQSGWTATTPVCVFPLVLTDTVLSLRAVFGNQQDQEGPLGQIIGLKFNDLNGDGTMSGEGEVGLSGWTITINGVTDPTFSDSTITGRGGFYSFTNLPLGSYEVCEVLQTGWDNTTPVCVTTELTETVLSRRAIFGNKVEDVQSAGCTLTQGFWKNKAGELLMAQLIPIGGLVLGTVETYTVTELQAILNTSVTGNALINLAHQLIAAKFNVLNGAVDASIGAQITAADALIGTLVVGVDSVDPSSTLGQQMIAVKTTLDNFNMGITGPGHCDDNNNEPEAK